MPLPPQRKRLEKTDIHNCKYRGYQILSTKAEKALHHFSSQIYDK